MPDEIRIAGNVAARVMEHALEKPAEECCGFLAGREGVITQVLPAVNAASDRATAYEIAAEELFRLMRAIRTGGLGLLGIYHSHPAGENQPSTRDIAQAYYPDVAYFIISPLADARRAIRAFWIRDGRAGELDVRTVKSE